MTAMPLSRYLFTPSFSAHHRAVRHAVLLGFGLLALVFVFAGCDYHDHDRDPRDPDVIVENDVRVFTFTLGDTDSRDEFRFDRIFSDSGNEVQFETDEVFYPQLAALLTRRAVDEGVVLLYVSDVVDENGLRRDGWTALPLAIGYDVDSPTGNDPDGFVDYVLTTTYTYNVERLYVNLVASDDSTIDFLDENNGLLDNLEAITFRLVTIPGFARGVDYSDYEAVKQAYGLPD